MNITLIEPLEAGRKRLSGPLTFDTVPVLFEQGRQLFKSGAVVELDLSGVERSDSAGIALLIGWVRLAQQQRAKITFHNIPEQLLGLARVGGVEQVLAFEQK